MKNEPDYQEHSNWATRGKWHLPLLFTLLCLLTFGCTQHLNKRVAATAISPTANASIHILTTGLSYDDTVSFIKKHSGEDITAGLDLLPSDSQSPLTGSYWLFPDYDTIISLSGQDGKITGMTFWTKADFSRSKIHRANTGQSITALKIDATTKTISVDKTRTTTTSIPEKQLADIKRATELERQADLVIHYERSDEILLLQRGQPQALTATEQTLPDTLTKLTNNKDLAVIILGKPLRHASPEPQLRQKVDKLETLLRTHGFKQIVFQLASATGRPTYRE